MELLLSTKAGQTLLRIVSAMLSVLALVFTPITTLLEKGTDGTETAKENHFMLESYYRSQDAATDGEHFYFSSKSTLLKTQLDGKTHITLNLFALPEQLQEDYGSAHIGGISYYNGKLYAGVEDSKVWEHPLVVVYNAETLEFEGEFYALDPSIHTRGMPWVSVDPQSGLLYTMDHSVSPAALYVYDTADNMSFVRSVPLSQPVERVQGADFFEGMLYGATQDATQAIYQIHPADGTVTKLIDRNLASGSEGEGMTVLPMEDGTVFHALDLGPIFINAVFRHYTMPE